MRVYFFIFQKYPPFKSLDLFWFLNWPMHPGWTTSRSYMQDSVLSAGMIDHPAGSSDGLAINQRGIETFLSLPWFGYSQRTKQKTGNATITDCNSPLIKTDKKERKKSMKTPDWMKGSDACHLLFLEHFNTASGHKDLNGNAPIERNWNSLSDCSLAISGLFLQHHKQGTDESLVSMENTPLHLSVAPSIWAFQFCLNFRQGREINAV